MNIATQLDAAMQARKPKSWSQAELSRKSGVPQPTISRTLKGRSVPDTETLTRLAIALGINFSHVAIDSNQLKNIVIGELEADLLEQFSRIKTDREKIELIGHIKWELDSRLKNMQNLRLPESTRQIANKK